MPSQIYDDLDPMYRAIWGKCLHHGYWLTGKESAEEAKENLIQEIFKHWQPSGHVADIGCGYGSFAYRLIQDFECTVTACTSSTTQASFIKATTVLNGNWLEQDLLYHSFDGAISLESTSHFETFEALLKKTHKALKPGANWIIADWFSENGNTFLLKHLAKTGNIPPWRSLNSFLSLAQHGGFKVSYQVDLSEGAAQTWSSLLLKALFLPFQRPKLIPQLTLRLISRPALLWTFPLLRLAYHQGNLSYHLIKLTKGDSLSSRPDP